VKLQFPVTSVSVHIDPTYPFDVVERIGLVTGEALVDGCVSLAGDRPVHHLEMHHQMARRRLVALRAFLRFRAWVKEADDFPRVGGMASRTFWPEEFLVLVLEDVAPLAIERDGLARLADRELLENGVVHLDGAFVAPLVLHMTTTAGRHIGVEHRRGLRQQFLGRHVAGNALVDSDALVGRMTARTFISEECVSLGQRPRTDGRTPARYRVAAGAIDRDRHGDRREDRRCHQDQQGCGRKFHPSHLSP